MQTPNEKSLLDEIQRILVRLYGERAEECRERLQLLIGRYGVETLPPLEERDETEVALITYGDSLLRSGERPLAVLRGFLESQLQDAVRTVHILPFFPYSSDDGFSVIDYRSVNPELGSWSDIEAIAGRFDIMADLVLNHCSRRSAWFKDFIAGVAPSRDYFLTMSPETDLGAVVRPRTSPLLTSTQTREGEKLVWTTFSADQVDLDFSNPDVLFEFLDILLLYISKGTRIVRLDAIAYLWKQVGTPCIHLEETHEIVKLFRAVTDLVAPGVLILTETNVPHAENISYFGGGDEAHMVYQFSLPPLLLHALHRGTVRHLLAWLQSLTPPPEGCTFLNFSASHDGIGVRPLEGIIERGEVAYLEEAIRERGGEVSMRVEEDGSESAYELNTTYFDALSEPGAWGSDVHIARFLCSQTVVLALQGIPAVYLHSLTATPNDRAGYQETGRKRSLHRKHWDAAELETLLADPTSVTARVFGEYTRRLRVRRGSPAFHPRAPQAPVTAGDAVLCVRRTSLDGRETVWCFHNLADREQTVGLTVDDGVDLLSADLEPVTHATPFTGRLEPYQCVWWRTGGALE